MPEQQNPARGFSKWLEGLTRPITQPVAEGVGELSRFVGSFIAPEQTEQFGQVGEESVHALPRTIAEAALTFGKRHPAVRALGVGDIMLRSFGHTQPEAPISEKAYQTALGTAGFLAMPAAGRAGRGIASQALSKTSKPLTQALALGAGGGAGVGAAMLGQQVLSGQEGILEPANLYGTALNILPFEALNTMKAYKARPQELKSTEPWQASWMGRNGQPKVMEFGNELEAKDFANSLRSGGLQQVETQGLGVVQRPGLGAYLVEHMAFGNPRREPTPGMKNQIPLSPIESSNLGAVGYDEKTQTLAVQFKGKEGTEGSIYHYHDVPPELFATFNKAESKGKFFGEFIKGKTGPLFDYTPLERMMVEESDPKLSNAERQRFSEEMEASGIDTPSQFAEASRRLQALRLQPGETPLQAIARGVGIDPKLVAEQDPNKVLQRAYDYGFSRFYHMGETPERADYLARQMLYPIARLEQWLGKTAFASMPPRERAHRMLGITAPGRSEVSNYILGIVEQRQSKFGSTKSPETQLFEVMFAMTHESVHNALHEVLASKGTSTAPQRSAISRAFARVHTTDPTELKATMEEVLRFILPKENHKEISRMNMDHYIHEPEEFLVDFAAALTMGSIKKENLANISDMMYFSDAETQAFANAVYRDISSIWRGVTDWFKGAQLGKVPEKKIATSLMLDEIQTNLSTIIRSSREAQGAVDLFLAHANRRLSGPIDPPPVITMERAHQMWSDTETLRTAAREVLGALGQSLGPSSRELLVKESQYSDMLDEARSMLFPNEATKKYAGERLTILDRLKPMQQLVAGKERTMPTTRQHMDLAMTGRAKVHQFQQEVWDKLWVDPTSGKVDWPRMEWVGREGTPQNTAFNEVGLAENARSHQGGLTVDKDQLLSRTEREKISPTYARLSEAEKARVDLSLAQGGGDIRRLGAKRELDGYRESVVNKLALFIQNNNKEVQSDEALRLARNVVRVTFDFNEVRKDPQVFPDPTRWQQESDLLMTELPLTEEAKATLLEKAHKLFGAWYKLGDQLMGPEKALPDGRLERPGLLFSLPEARYNEWHLAWKVASEPQMHLEHFKTRAQAAKRLGEVQKLEGLEWLQDYNRKDQLDALRGKADKLAMGSMEAEQTLYDTVMAKLNREDPVFEELFERMKYVPNEAREQLLTSPYMQNRRFIPGRETLNLAEGLMRYVDAAAHTTGKRYIKEQGHLLWNNKDMRANPDIRTAFTEYLRFASEGEGREWTLFNNYLFFHVLGLNPSSTVVEWTQQLTTFVPYLVRQGIPIRGAYKLTRDAQTDLLKANLKSDGKLENPEEEMVRQQAIKDRSVDVGFAGDLYSAEDFNFAKSLSMFSGNNKLGDAYDLIRRPLYQLMGFSRHAYGMFTRNNSEVAIVAGFRHFRSQGQTWEQAYLNAKHLNDVTMFAGGRVARPMVLQKMGNWSGVGGAMYMLQSYMLNMLALQGRLGKEAIGRAPIGKAEQVAAQKAFALALGTQAVLAGVMGLPLIAPATAVIAQVTGHDIRKDLRKAFLDLFNDDEDMGYMMTDGAMNGVFNISGVDFGSRLGLANFIGVSPYDGFSWKNVAGPGASMLESWTKGAKEASSGHWYEALKNASPVMLRNIVKYYHDDAAVRDRAGRLIYQPTRSEKNAMLVGFKPAQAARQYEKQRLLEASEDKKNQEVADLRTEIAKLLVAGKVEAARSRLLNGIREVGPVDPRDLLRESAELAVRMQAPLDAHVGSRANAEEAARIAALYGHVRGGSERGRVLKQASLERSMGLPFTQPPSLATLRTATFIDRYLEVHPRASYATARLAADRQFNQAYRRRSSLARALLEAE